MLVHGLSEEKSPEPDAPGLPRRQSQKCLAGQSPGSYACADSIDASTQGSDASPQAYGHVHRTNEILSRALGDQVLSDETAAVIVDSVKRELVPVLHSNQTPAYIQRRMLRICSDALQAAALRLGARLGRNRRYQHMTWDYQSGYRFIAPAVEHATLQQTLHGDTRVYHALHEIISNAERAYAPPPADAAEHAFHKFSLLQEEKYRYDNPAQTAVAFDTKYPLELLRATADRAPAQADILKNSLYLLGTGVHSRDHEYISALAPTVAHRLYNDDGSDAETLAQLATVTLLACRRGVFGQTAKVLKTALDTCSKPGVSKAARTAVIHHLSLLVAGFGKGKKPAVHKDEDRTILQALPEALGEKACALFDDAQVPLERLMSTATALITADLADTGVFSERTRADFYKKAADVLVRDETPSGLPAQASPLRLQLAQALFSHFGSPGNTFSEARMLSIITQALVKTASRAGAAGRRQLLEQALTLIAGMNTSALRFLPHEVHAQVFHECSVTRAIGDLAPCILKFSQLLEKMPTNVKNSQLLSHRTIAMRILQQHPANSSLTAIPDPLRAQLLISFLKILSRHETAAPGSFGEFSVWHCMQLQDSAEISDNLKRDLLESIASCMRRKQILRTPYCDRIIAQFARPHVAEAALAPSS